MTEYNNVVQNITLSNEAITSYQEDGYLIIPNFIEKSKIAPLTEEIFHALEVQLGVKREALFQATNTSDKLRQTQGYLKDSLMDGLINSDNTLSVASQLIGGKAVRYLPFTAVKAGGGGGQFHFHQDNNYTRHQPALGSLNIWVALSDMSVENGCLRVAPASHKLGQLASINAGEDEHLKVKDDPEEYTSLAVKAGDAIAFTRLTVHGSGPNDTTQPRVAYALQYHRDDVKYLDNDTGEWKLLVEEPRFQTPPLASLTR